jgi:hypothetical protein
MISTLLQLLRLCPFLCGGHRQLALENLALRHQLTVYRRTVARPRLRRGDRLFWVALSRLWRGWKQALVIVAPDTVPALAAATVPRLLVPGSPATPSWAARRSP